MLFRSKIKNGDDYVVVDNWYTGTSETIKLTERSAKHDAEKHFKRYQKKKRSLAYLDKQIDDAKQLIEYLESVDSALSLSTSKNDLAEIMLELVEYGLIKEQNSKKKLAISEPRKFVIDGFSVLVGKSNLQNDKITKEARGEDIWLHTQGIHGSHVVIKAQGKNVPYKTIEKVCGITAFFSKARQSENVAVDFTKAKNVHKKRGSAPGKVDYFGAKTVFVNPTAPSEN